MQVSWKASYMQQNIVKNKSLEIPNDLRFAADELAFDEKDYSDFDLKKKLAERFGSKQIETDAGSRSAKNTENEIKNQIVPQKRSANEMENSQIQNLHVAPAQNLNRNQMIFSMMHSSHNVVKNHFSLMEKMLDKIQI